MFYKILGFLLGWFMVMLVILAIMTPDKDKNGYFTDLYKYWTDDAYFNNNF